MNTSQTNTPMDNQSTPFNQQVVELKKQGLSLSEIALKLGMSKTNVHRILSEEKAKQVELRQSRNKKEMMQVSSSVRLKQLELQHEREMHVLRQKDRVLDLQEQETKRKLDDSKKEEQEKRKANEFGCRVLLNKFKELVGDIIAFDTERTELEYNEFKSVIKSFKRLSEEIGIYTAQHYLVDGNELFVVSAIKSCIGQLQKIKKEYEESNEEYFDGSADEDYEPEPLTVRFAYTVKKDFERYLLQESILYTVEENNNKTQTTKSRYS